MSQRHRNGETGRFRGDQGITLIELLIGMVLLAVIAGVAVSGLVNTARTTTATNDRLKKSNDATLISTYVGKDAQSAGGLGADNAAVSGIALGVKVAGASSGFCPDGSAAPVVRFEWLERTAGATPRQVAANYGIVDGQLIRRQCKQDYPSGAGATTSTITLGHNVGSASVVCTPACVNNVVSVPQTVRMNVTEAFNNQTEAAPYSFAVTGAVRSSASATNPTPMVVPLLALGVPAAGPCPVPQGVGGSYAHSSGIAMNSSGFGGGLTVYGAAAINSAATTTATCGAAGNLPSSSYLATTQTMVLTGGTCTNCGATTPLGSPVPDPYAGMAAPSADCALNLPNPATSNGGATLNPGVYYQAADVESFSVVTMNPGTYVFCRGFEVEGISQLIGNNVTLYFAPVTWGNTLTINSATLVNLSAPTSGPYAHILVWQANPSTASAATTGDVLLTTGALIFGANYSGVIYAPQAMVQMAAFIPIFLPFAYIDGIVARSIYLGSGARGNIGLGPQTTTSVTSSPNPSTPGQSVSLSAQVAVVAPATGTPTGTVTFFDGGTQIGSPVNLAANGTASLATTTLTPGNHEITAAYSGNATFQSSLSGSVFQVVKQGASTTVLTSTPPVSALGSNVALTATVSPVAPAVGVPTGTVTFYEGATQLGQATLAAGQATINLSTLAVGSHTLSAVYAGDTAFTGSTSATITHVVRNAATIAISSAPNPSIYGGGIQFDAAVSGAGPQPTGTVTFFDGATQLGQATLANGVATLAGVTTLAAGSHTITATYAGDGNYAPVTSAPMTQTVNQVGTTTALVSAPNPSVRGQSVALTATVSAPGPVAPAGTVTFFDGATSLGSAGAVNGTATLNITTLTVGSHTALTAVYGGNANFAASTSPAAPAHVVDKATSAIALTSTPNPPVGGQPATFTATLTAVAPGAGTPTGTVVFSIDGNAQTPTPIAGGQANLAATLTAGAHTITVTYAGDGNFTGSNASLSPQVKNLTTTALVSSNDPAGVGESVTFTATVSGPVGQAAPTGTVTFTDTFGGGTVFSAALVPGAANTSTAAWTRSFTSVADRGAHPTTAVYGGSAGYASSTSNTVSQDVLYPTTVTLAVSPNPGTVGGSATLTATVVETSPGSPAQNSTVRFFRDYGLPTQAQLGADGNLGNNTPRVGTFNLNNLAAGSYVLTAVYDGDGTFADSVSAPVTLVVKVGTTLVVTATPNPATVGATATYTATVTRNGGAGNPTGSITFTDNFSGQTATVAPITPSGANAATATWTVTYGSNATKGTHTVDATYSGDAAFGGSTDSVDLVVKYATSTALSLNRTTVGVGGSVTMSATVTETGAGSPTGTVTYYDGATPLGSANVGSNFQLSPVALSTGVHNITAVYNGDGNFSGTTSAPVALTVNARPTITAINPTSGGRNTNLSITVTGTGFVNGATVTFTPVSGFCNASTTSLSTAYVSATQLTVNVTFPNSAGTGNNCRRTLTVTNPDTGTFTTNGSAPNQITFQVN